MTSRADLLAEGSLPAAWAKRWRADPGLPAVHDPAEGWLTRRDLDERSAVVAGRLYGAGLRKGDRVVVSARASARLVVAHAACLRLGLIVVPVNSAYRRAEVDHIVADASPRAAIVDNPVWQAWFGDVVVTGPAVELPDAAAPSLDLATPGDPALIGYTSGTTGAPKGAVLSHGNLLAGAEAIRIAWRWTADDRLVLALPLFHMHGLGNGIHGSLLAGGSVVLVPKFDVDVVLDAIRDHAATLFFGVPTMYRRLAESPRARELQSLRLCVSGSAPLPAALHRQIEAVSGQRVLERYGMTETVMLVSNPYDGERRPGTVGFPLPGVEVRLDADPGEVLVRGPNVFAGYWRNREATAAAFRDGWFRTGDIGSLDADGYLTLVGRSSELIISGGFNVYPRQVEEVLRAHPAVGDVAVAGTPSEEWGEAVTAYVVLADGHGPDEVAVERLREHVDAELAPYKQPRRVFVVAELPRNALGKVQKHLLEDAADGRDS